MSYYYPNNTAVATGYVSNAPPSGPVLYGFAVPPEQVQQYYSAGLQPTPGYVVAATNVACVPAEADELAPLPRLYDSESDFLDGIIDILGESDTDRKRMKLAPAYPIAEGNTNFSAQPVIPALSCYAVTEATRIEDDEGIKTDYDIYDFPADCVAAFESMDMSDNPPNANNTATYPIQVEPEKKAVASDLFCVGTIDIDYLKSLNDADEKRIRRKEAIDRWKLKKLKKKSVIKAVKHSVTTFSEGAAAACNTLLNPRQKATAKRERENGKFKKAQVQWVSVTVLFSTFDDFK